MQISRRNALLGAGAAVAVTGATTGPLAIKAAGVKTALAGVQADESLLAIEQEWFAIHKELQERSRQWSLAYNRLPAWARGGTDQHGREWGWPDVGNLPEFKSACKAGLSTRPPCGRCSPSMKLLS